MDLKTLEALKLAVVGLLLAWAAYEDLKKREVSPKYAAAIAVLGGTASIYEYASSAMWLPMLIAIVGLVAFYAAGIASAMLPQHFFGGGDAKLMMALSLALPFPPIWSLDHMVVFFTPAFPLTLFVNAVLFSLPLFLVFRKTGVPFLVPLLLSLVFSVLYGDALLNLLSLIIVIP